MKFKGKVALVTGATGGMGKATVRALAQEGLDGLGLHYHSSAEKAEAMAKELRGLGIRVEPVKADVARRAEVASMVKRVVDGLGRLDILVCFAGHPFRREDWFADFRALTPEQLQAPLSSDLLGSVFCCQEALPHLAKTRGRIILIGSTPALTGDTVGISYLMAKAGILALAKSLALLAGPQGVHVNAIAPGSIATEAMKGLGPEEEKELREASALKRFGTPEEIARKVVFLASGDSDFLTGQTLVVDGGYLLW